MKARLFNHVFKRAIAHDLPFEMFVGNITGLKTFFEMYPIDNELLPFIMPADTDAKKIAFLCCSDAQQTVLTEHCPSKSAYTISCLITGNASPYRPHVNFHRLTSNTTEWITLTTLDVELMLCFELLHV